MGQDMAGYVQEENRRKGEIALQECVYLIHVVEDFLAGKATLSNLHQQCRIAKERCEIQ